MIPVTDSKLLLVVAKMDTMMLKETKPASNAIHHALPAPTETPAIPVPLTTIKIPSVTPVPPPTEITTAEPVMPKNA